MLTAEQRYAIKGLIEGIKNKQVVSLGGLGGSGKSFCVNAITKALDDFAICAFTGKAADVLKQKGVETAQTIHSLIYKPVPTPNGGVEFYLKDSLDCAGVIIDEASMVSKEIFEDLKSFKLPLILVGDHGQLPPVGDTNFNVMINPDYCLETVHRNAGPIAHFAEHLRSGRNPQTFPACKEIRLAYPGEINDAIMEVDQTICARNVTRVRLNAAVRDRLGYKGIVTEGERLISLKNARKLGLFNGQQGIVTAFRVSKQGILRITFKTRDQGFVDISSDSEQFGNLKAPEYDADAPHPFDYAYCATAHKLQGDEFDKVCVVEEICAGWDHRRWRYTAASRAKKSLIWVLA